VIAPIGAGGMGEVYRARDTRLGRDVAIKVLPADRMADEDRRRRFVQEARAASALNHPNIVTIHEIESADGIDFIVMEYVRGRSLDDMIPKQGMRLGEILRVSIPIADALASAHASGIVHRDVKPANVMVTEDGLVKVLDFGLAKLVSPNGESPKSETATDPGVLGARSRPGTVAGTLGYMSPEQASAGKVDARSDVFSFGAVLYEMATGRRAFSGSSTAEVLAALMKEDPKPPSEVVADLPKELDRLIRRCLQKEPARRFQHTADVKLELEQIKEDSETGRKPVPPADRKRRPWLAAGVAIAVLLVAATWWWRRPPDVPLDPPRLEPVTSMSGGEVNPTLSPDGDQLAFIWNGEKRGDYDIYLKMIGSSEIRRLTTDPAPDIAPRWSPDGRWIAHLRLGPDGVGRVQLISPVTGAGRKLSDFPVRGWYSWSPDGRWLAVTPDRSAKGADTTPPESASFYLLPVDGGEPKPLRIPQASGNIESPSFSPDGRRLAYISPLTAANNIAVVDLGPDYIPTGPPRIVTPRPVWAMDHPVWTRDGKSLLYADWGITRLWRVAITGDRAPEPIEIAGLGAWQPAVAAKRDRLVFAKQQGSTDIYRFQAGRPVEPVLTSSFAEGQPELSPDGRRVVFMSARSGEMELWIAEADGSNPTQLTHAQGPWQGSPCWSPDGWRIAFDRQTEDGHWDVWTIDADGGSPRRLTKDPRNENVPEWSRDGRFIYFAAQREGDDTEKPDIWRVPVAGGAEERITHGGGARVQESIDGKTLFVMRGFGPSSLVAQPVAGGQVRELVKCVSSFVVSTAGIYYKECSGESLFIQDPATGRERVIGKLEGQGGGSDFTVSPDGNSFLYSRLVNPGNDLMMIENFR
jgi:eukaryotic-like serine/threonine-protein kinase